MWWLFSEFRNELQSSVNWWPLLAKTEIRNQRQVGNVSGDRAWLTVNRPSGKKCWKLSWSTLTWHLGYALCILSFFPPWIPFQKCSLLSAKKSWLSFCLISKIWLGVQRIKFNKAFDSLGPSAASSNELLREQRLRFPISSSGKNSAILFWSTLNATRCWMQKCLCSVSYHHFQFCHWLVGCMGFYEPQTASPTASLLPTETNS